MSENKIKIKDLHEYSGERFYPLTHAKAVIDTSGDSLDTFWSNVKKGFTYQGASTSWSELSGKLSIRNTGKYFGEYVYSDLCYHYILIVSCCKDSSGSVLYVQTLISEMSADGLNSEKVDGHAVGGRLLFRTGTSGSWGNWTDDMSLLRASVSEVVSQQANIGVQIGALQAKDTEFDASVSALQAKDSEHSSKISALEASDGRINNAIESLVLADEAHDKTLDLHTGTLESHGTLLVNQSAEIRDEVARAKSAEEAIIERINALIGGADIDFDTLKEIQDWIEGHGKDAAEMLVSIQENEGVNNAQTDVLKRLDSRLEPLVIVLSGGGGLYERGISRRVTIGWNVTKGGNTVPVNKLATTVNGVDVSGLSSVTEDVTESKSWRVECAYSYDLIPKIGSKEPFVNTVTGISSTEVTFVGAKYAGASVEGDASLIDKTMLVKQELSRTPVGSYRITSTETSYIWFVVPSEMTITKVTINGFDYPMETVVERDGYKYYRSSNQVVAGTYTFVVSGTGI